MTGDAPRPGYYTTRLVRDGPPVPVRIWLADGRPRCAVNGKDADVEKIYPFCKEITKDVYDRMVATRTTSTVPAEQPIELGQIAPVKPR